MGCFQWIKSSQFSAGIRQNPCQNLTGPCGIDTGSKLKMNPVLLDKVCLKNFARIQSNLYTKKQYGKQDTGRWLFLHGILFFLDWRPFLWKDRRSLSGLIGWFMIYQSPWTHCFYDWIERTAFICGLFSNFTWICGYFCRRISASLSIFFNSPLKVSYRIVPLFRYNLLNLIF